MSSPIVCSVSHGDVLNRGESLVRLQYGTVTGLEVNAIVNAANT